MRVNVYVNAYKGLLYFRGFIANASFFLFLRLVKY